MYNKTRVVSVIAILLFIVSVFAIWVYRDSFYNSADVTTTTIKRQALKDNTRNITNQLLKSNRDSLALSTKPAPSIINNQLSLAKQRKALMIELAAKDPKSFTENIIPENLAQTMDPSIQPYIEKPASITGKTLVLSSDSKQSSEQKYLVAVGSKYYQIYSPEKLALQSKTNITVSGYLLDQKIVVISNKSIDAPTSTKKLVAPITRHETTNSKVAVVLMNFKNNPTSQPISTSQVKDSYFTSADSVKQFYNEVSYSLENITGGVDPTGDVYGWYNVPYANTTCNEETDVMNWSAAADAKLQQALGTTSIYSTFTNIVYLFPETPACQWLGLGELGYYYRGNRTWINYTPSSVPLNHVASHEYGHNIGFEDASSLNCQNSIGQRVSIGGSCQIVAYNDPFSVMGNISMMHPGAVEKYSAQWWGPLNYEFLETYVNQTYSLYPIEQAAVGKQTIIIPKEYDSTQERPMPLSFYVLEYRQPYGFDKGVVTAPPYDGIVIHVYSMLGSSLIDTTPLDGIQNPTLQVGETFVDTENNISIRLVSADTTKADVEIITGKPNCLRSLPQLSSNYTTLQTVAPGGSRQFSLTVTNKDSAACAPTKFDLANFVYKDYASPINPAAYGISVTMQPESVFLSSGNSATVTVTVKSSASTPDNYYDIVPTASNSSAPYILNLTDILFNVDRAINMIPTGSISFAAPTTKTAYPPITFKYSNAAKINRYRLTNNGLSWEYWNSTSYLNYNPTTQKGVEKTWYLTNTIYGGKYTEGTKKVYAQLMNTASRASKAVSASIIYNPRGVTALKVTRFKTRTTKQYVKIKNQLTGPIVLKGFVIKNKSGRTYTIKSYTLGAGKTLTIYAYRGRNRAGRLYIGRKFWRRGERFYLYDANKLLVAKR